MEPIHRNSLKPGHRLHWYRIETVLGQGGFGITYLAHDSNLDQEVAIKEYLPIDLAVREQDLAVQPASDNYAERFKWGLDRFMAEARTLARFKHPNIVRVLAVFEANGTGYMVMEYEHGDSLHELLSRHQTVEEAELLSIVLPILGALEKIHERGFIHRDIKPANIFMRKDGSPVLIDFGSARQALGVESRALTTLVSPGYAPFEQYFSKSEQQGPWTDIYGLGATLYRAVTGRPPQDALQRSQALHEAARDSLVGVGEIGKGHYSAPFLKAIDHALQFRQKDRPQTVAEWRREFGVLPDTRLAHGRRPETETPPPGGPPTAATSAPAVPQTEDVGPTSLRGEAVASRIPPTYRASYTTGAEPGRGRRESHPKDLGRYRIIECLSEGSVGPLYKAWDQVADRVVALKVISIDSRVAAVEQERFFRAGRLWKRLKHPNVVRIYDCNSQPDARFIVTELLEGMDLGHYIDTRKSLSLADKLEIIMQVCNGLNHIHGHGIIHRDIRPTNIFLSNQLLVKILDSHITREADPHKDQLTVVGQVLGDPKYIAPEQFTGNPVYCSDIFSMGALLCDLLTYKVPASSDPRERFESLGSAQPSIPKELVNIVEQALTPDPAQRLSDLDEMESRIEQVRRNLVGNVPRRADRKTPCPRVVFPLHGIRTHAAWQRAFAEVAQIESWRCRLDTWNFGYFSLLRFLLPGQRRTRVKWFRRTYRDEVKDRDLQLDDNNRPSIVAHSFGTYILGNALLSYDYLRFDKIILCGSILPTNFPWHELIDRGQVQAVRNEYGTRDLWTGIVKWFVRGAGPSGIHGFTCRHERLEQKRFLYSHSEYFETGHMTHYWIPFLNRALPDLPARDSSPSVGKSNVPWALYLTYSMAFCLAVFFFVKGVWVP